MIFFLRTTPGNAGLFAQPADTLSGQVVSTYGPVEDARVRIAGESAYVLSDGEGRFTLQAAHLPADKQVVITGGKEGWFNNATVGSRTAAIPHIVLNPVPQSDDPNYRFIAPTVCARCHVKIAQYWDKSKMAHTTSNPKVLQLYYGTDKLNNPDRGPGFTLDNPGQQGNCIACHAPSIAGAPGASWDMQQALYSARSEWDGISCEYCHKIRRVLKDDQSPSGYKAVQTRVAPSQGNSILVFGPLDDVVAPPMAASYDGLYEEGNYCSVCHSHIAPVKQGHPWDWEKVYTEQEWAGFGLHDGTKLPIQTTFQEWRQWQAGLDNDDANKGKKCQDCHMSWRKDMLPYDNYIVDGMARNMWGTSRDPSRIHPHQFDGGTPIQLATALGLEINGEVDGQTLTVTVRITNTNGGHWIPTGETMRSVLLLVKAADEAGHPLKLIDGERLPPWAASEDPARDNETGRPGAVFARVLQDDQGNLNVPFWRATSIAFDNRIRPKTSVVRTYKFSLAGADGEPGVTANLVYRPAHRPLAQSKQWDVNDIPITSAAW